MGRRSNTATVVAILQTLLQQRTCSQAELGRCAGVSSQVARRHLRELQEKGFRLESVGEHPHVKWTVPNSWFPDAVLFKRELVPDLLHQLCHLPQTETRDRLIQHILDT